MKIDYSRENHEKILSALGKTDPAVCRQIMSNFDSYMKWIRKDLLLQTLSAHLYEAEVNYRKRNLHGEEKELKTTLNMLKKGEISDEDLNDSKLLDYSTGTALTLQKVKNRLKHYGWNERRPEFCT